MESLMNFPREKIKSVQFWIKNVQINLKEETNGLLYVFAIQDARNVWIWCSCKESSKNYYLNKLFG